MKLKAPKGAVAASVDGVEYRVTRGVVDVPDKHSDRLREHGFVAADDAPQPLAKE